MIIIFYSILAFLATAYISLSAISFFNNYESYATYREVYKRLPEINFTRKWYIDILYSDDDKITYDSEYGYMELGEGVCLFNGYHEYFNLYSWYYRVKFEKWFKENY